MGDREWSQESLVAHASRCFQERPPNLAGALALLQCLTACAESCLSEEELQEVFGDYDKFTFDYYDMSFEVHGVDDPGLTNEQQERFWGLGFSRFWTHVEGERRKPGERFYRRPVSQTPQSLVPQRGT